MQAAEIVQEARNSLSGLPSSQTRQLLIYQVEGADEDQDGYNPHAELRTLVLKEVQKNLSLKDHALVRFLLEQEKACRWDNTETELESIYHCGFLLSLLGQIEDLQLLWQAKMTNMDTGAGFDSQFLVGAGVLPTLAYLHSLQEDWAKKAEVYIEKCQRAGDFNDLEGYRSFKLRYFEIDPSVQESSTAEHPASQ